MDRKIIKEIRFVTEVCRVIDIAGSSVGKIAIELDKSIVDRRGDKHVKHLYMEIDKDAQFYDAHNMKKVDQIDLRLSDEEKEPAFVCFDVDESNNTYKVYDDTILNKLYEKKLSRALFNYGKQCKETAIDSISDVTQMVIKYDDGSEDFFWLPYNGDMEKVSTWIDKYKNKYGYGFLCLSANKKVFDYISKEDADDVEKLKSCWKTILEISNK